jgi:hypothetical protein
MDLSSRDTSSDCYPSRDLQGESPSLSPFESLPHLNSFSKTWTVTISEDERMEMGPVDALRLDISEGNNTAFYGLNVEGWVLYGGSVSLEGYDDE